MSDQFLGEIRIMSFNYAPRTWAMCNGQTLPINQNQPLFALLGTTYGGNGQTTFNLPNLQGSVPLHVGNGFVLGQKAGEATHSLSIAEIPSHTHTLSASPNNADDANIKNTAIFATASNIYTSATNLTAIQDASVGNAGSGQGHPNMQPYLVLNFCIALSGIFPSRS